jgi:c-di-GMP-binding flagellar brake protein YcgR
MRYLSLAKHNEGSGRTRDLSTRGAQVEMVERHATGDRLEIILDLPDSSQGICIDADVVWQSKSECVEEECNYKTGLVFKRIRDCHKQEILDYVIDRHPEQSRARWWQGV